LTYVIQTLFFTHTNAPGSFQLITGKLHLQTRSVWSIFHATLNMDR